MKNYSTFDILGPIMIGPSSSHTAGAARLGKVAMEIAGNDFEAVTFYLHGSFAKTYKGHGTDRALVAGILGMEPYDERLKNSLNIAKEKGIKIKFVETDLGYEHPNTVKIVFYMKDGKKVNVTGSSIGGGSIVITNINGYNVEFSGMYPTLIIKHIDKKGIISKVTTVLAKHDINIATMKVNRKIKGKEASMIIETDHEINSTVIEELQNIKEITNAKAINPTTKRC
ncbi:L-serine ammonia-lyase, iron-sulfur-dependent subunit beta [Caloranaerobacter azorensis]|uniref:L-serine deaminase n=3 Tax=Caloranaerobacter azorensis TaxID=116090 RepID=A0A1M5SFT0_9FIRM|nr:L-serine ammonia-lyase, iron-sulfur-dependent subunit beta [Caloranaerobacter azorensis]KGG80812.1 serine dehydratase [Caloranaerobacter azorensis H53214]QIB26398.1 L-serine ammonia-lyase, iron-sulfur-dependent, subunit beta [Caloranaerobacter azorensis]SHH37376.1 L-serine dehydratase [Caloranaerobacter azorensis DSM 13643]